MEPIVNGLTKKYKACMKFEHVNYHKRSEWHDLLFPIGSPEYALLDSSKQILYRWFGSTREEDFEAVLNLLCT